MDQCLLRPVAGRDRAWIARKTIEEWGSEIVVVHGTVFHPARQPGIMAELEESPVGLITYALTATACEIVTLNSWRKRSGIGSQLVEAVRQVAVRAGCQRLFLVTTNDNAPALRFFQKRGFSLASVRINAIEVSRRLKPAIPLTGVDGIPIRDEIELDYLLEENPSQFKMDP